MTPEEKEKFYDDEIGPALLDLGMKCHKRGIPFIAVVEWDASRPGEGGWGKTIGVVDVSKLSEPVKRVYRAAMASDITAMAITTVRGEQK